MAAPADLAVPLRFDPEQGLVGLAEALADLDERARAAGFAIDRHAIANELQAATFRCRAAAAVRLLVSPAGGVAIEVRG